MVHVEDRKLKPHPLAWVVEPLINDPSYLEKSMFGCRGCYLPWAAHIGPGFSKSEAMKGTFDSNH